MLGLTFSFKLDWGSYIISIAKTASKKIEALIHSMKFLSPEVVLYLCESTMQSCMEYCCHSISVNLPCSLAWNTVVTLSLGIYHAVLHGILLSLYLCESTMQSCMEYCCHIWACVPSCYLELLELMDRLQRHICRA